ncbi:MAG: rhomboid family intramembrane serine protease [Bacteroidetes bacterium]|nr:rhomboid family intramembrane serine protease [Bacteroidota bacterium]
MTLIIVIIILTSLISVIGFNNVEIFDRFKFNAYDVKHSNHWYRFFTYGFFHAGYIHLVINMIVLYSFGVIVETYFQNYFPVRHLLYFLLLYTGGLLLSVIPAFGKHKNDVFYNAVGASGAISAVVFSSIILYPSGRIFLFFIPIGIPSPVFGVIYILYEAWMSKRAKDNIGHDAHLWGAIFGLIFTIALKPSLLLIFFQQLGFSM